MKSLLTATFLFMFLTSEALAFCTWGFVPSEREYQPLNATEAFISYEDGVQTLVLKPEWQGNAKEFGIVYPTPSKPKVTEAPADLFRQLEEATNPFIEKDTMLDNMETMSVSFGASEETVTVVEEKQVGDYSVTVLTATDAGDLVEWLGDNKYNYSAGDEDKVEYYVEQGGFYFVALKVDASDFDGFPKPLSNIVSEGAVAEGGLAIELDSSPVFIDDEWFWGELSPIQISFATDKPQLPMQTLKSNMPTMTFDLYTLSDKPVYVPGVDTIWSNLVDSEFLNQVPALASFNPKAKWLLRQEVNFNPSNSNEDLYLSQVETDDFTTVSAGSLVRFNPSKLDTNTGIIAGVRGQVVQTDTAGNSFVFTRSLTINSEGEDVLQLQRLLNAEGFIVSSEGAGSVGNETTYFGGRTKQALIKYQNFYRADILTPVNLSVGTGYFGPSTIKFVNR